MRTPTDPAITGAGADVRPTLASAMNAPRVRGVLRALACVVVFLAVQRVLWPAPAGVLVKGVILGLLSSLLALGLALVYRANRVVNFAQAGLGVAPATVMVLLIANYGWPYPVGFVLALASAGVVGVVVYVMLIRQFFKAPRLILTVVTIGVSQMLLGLSALVADWLDGSSFTRVEPPFSFRLTISPVTFNAFHLIAAIAAPVAIVALFVFLRRSRVGLAIRATAENAERAATLGVPVERIQTVVWAVAATLSALGVFLASGVGGEALGTPGVVAGPATLLRALAAAVIGRMERLGVIVAAAVGLGMLDQAIFWHTGNGQLVEPIIFLVILGALLLRRRRGGSRVEDSDTSSWRAVAEARPVPVELAGLPEVRWTRRAVVGVLAAVALAVPWMMGPGRTNLAALVLIYMLVGLSLVVLTGWAGQVSLGHVAFMAIGAGVSGAITVHWHWDLLESFLIAAVCGAGAAVLVGLPALRIKGLFFAVTTFALAVTTSTYLLNADVIHWLPGPNDHIDRLPLLGRLAIDSERRFYYLCLAFVGIALLMIRGMRRSRTGRALMGIRDNQRAAESYGINASRVTLTAFAASGALAAVAGALFVHSQQTLDATQFGVTDSLRVFTMVVIGGLGSVPGAVIGALYLNGVTWFLVLLPDRGPIQWGVEVLATGGGLIAVLGLMPNGLGSLLYGVRDIGLRAVGRRRGLLVPSLIADAAGTRTADDAARTRKIVAPPKPQPAIRVAEPAPLLAVRNLDAGYDGVQVLFGVDFEVQAGEIVALLGTNGAGKSTLLRVVAGLTRAKRGSIELDRAALRGRATKIASCGVSLVPGGRGVFPSLTVGENLRVATWRLDGDAASAHLAMEDVLGRFPVLRRRWATAAGNLSGGEQQMLTLAQSFLRKPRLILIDELSLGLAPVVVSELMDAVRTFRDEGATVVLVEQSVNVALTIADEAYYMEKGEVRFHGPTAELLHRPDLLRSVYMEGAATRGTTRGHAEQPESPRRTSNNGPTSTVLEVAEVSKHYGGILAINGLSLRLEAGQILGIIGPNGAGKTTLFDIISGYLVPDSGAIILNGADVTSYGPDRRARLGLGRSFQDARLFPNLTVNDTIALALERSIEIKDPVAAALNLPSVADSERKIAARVAELVELMGLEAYRDKFIRELSTGTRRVVDIACTFAHRPSVLLLDEPSSGIAQRETEALAPLLRRVQVETGASLIVIEHDMPLLRDVSDELIALEFGQVVTRGNPDDVLTDPRVVACYLGTDDATVYRSGALGG
ncbi:ABC transporter permease subunit [Pseudofrankia sp. BMG5.37]|uniref:ABC transporter permease subunit n=1 Tax=Pseudofrankia sp. BMG5.37 TaxID=3050035 RepID=UPI0028942212|nr:ATP-binding cassette domain-containing protein [Pseudofrankia sp. BMG5.37]MDT3439268.1 ATP-binding cassette domain-containing protein [Pseudofrankia sp. BMG5.37]